MHIHRATPEDAPGIAAVSVAAWRRAYRGILSEDFLAGLQEESRAREWRASLLAGAPRVLVTRANGGAVSGYVAFDKSRDDDAPEDTGEIFAIYVAPDFQRADLGRALLAAAMEELRAAGFRAVSLWVIEGNEPAIRFYEAAGFRTAASDWKTFTLGGAQLTEFRYQRALSAPGGGMESSGFEDCAGAANPA